MKPKAPSQPLDHDESKLIASAREGDDRAFEALASSYRRLLEYHVRSFDPPSSVYDDLLQEGLIGLLKAVRGYDGKSSSFATFASHCIRNSIISGVRRYNSQSKTGTFDVSDLSEEDRSPSAEEVTLDGIRAGLLYEKVVSVLSDYERMIFEMYLSELSYESIAFAIGKDVKSVENAVYRIRTKLKTIVNATDDRQAPPTAKIPKG